MNTYDTRKLAGNKAEALVASWLQPHSTHVHFLSPEKYIPRDATWHLARVIEHLKQSDNSTHHDWAKSLKHYRYQPDYLVDNLHAEINGNIIHEPRCYVDAKASKWVEKEAYEHYLELEANGTPTYLAAILDIRPTTILWVRSSKLKLHGDEWETPTNGSGLPCKQISFWGSGTIEIEVGEPA
jgi:hypothetical protein